MLQLRKILYDKCKKYSLFTFLNLFRWKNRFFDKGFSEQHYTSCLLYCCQRRDRQYNQISIEILNNHKHGLALRILRDRSIIWQAASTKISVEWAMTYCRCSKFKSDAKHKHRMAALSEAEKQNPYQSCDSITKALLKAQDDLARYRSQVYHLEALLINCDPQKQKENIKTVSVRSGNVDLYL